MRCPHCGRRLRKEDVVVMSEFDMTQNGKLTAKIALCSICGKELGRREFA